MRKENTPIIVSSGKTNRKGFKIPVQNLDFSEYLLSPVALSEHITGVSVGRFEEIKIVKEKVQATPVWSSTPLGQQLKQQYIEGSINAVSIGGQCKLSDDRKIAEHFIVLEISWVTVGADPGAVAPFGDNIKNLSYEIDYEKESSYSPIKLSEQINLSGYQYLKLSMEIEQEKGFVEKVVESVKNLTKKEEEFLSLNIESENLNNKTLKEEPMELENEKDKPIEDLDINEQTILKNESDGKSDEYEEDLSEEEKKLAIEEFRKRKINIRKKNLSIEGSSEPVDLNENVAEKVDLSLIENKEEIPVLEEEKTEILSSLNVESELKHVQSDSFVSEEKKDNVFLKSEEIPVVDEKILEEIPVIEKEQSSVKLNTEIEKEDKKTFDNEKKDFIVLSEKEFDEKLQSKINENKNISASDLEQVKLKHNSEMENFENQTKNVKVTNNMDFSLFMEKEKEAGLTKLLEEKNESAILGLFDSINKTDNGNLFLETLKFKGDEKNFFEMKKNDFMQNRDAINQKLSYEASTRLNASNDFVENPYLDNVAFSMMLFSSLFAKNGFFDKIPTVPVQQLVRNVGVVFANSTFKPVITRKKAGTDTTNPYVHSPVNQYDENPRSMEIYEYTTNTQLYKDGNMELRNYNKMMTQWQRVLNGLNEDAVNGGIFSISKAISDAKIAFPNDVMFFDNLTGTDYDVSTLWNLLKDVVLPAGFTKKGITRFDITRMVAYIQAQNAADVYKPIVCMDAWMYSSFISDPSVVTLLTRDVNSDSKGSLTDFLGFNLDRRSSYGRYDTTTNRVVDPYAASNDLMVQYGMLITPELNVRGISDISVISTRNPSSMGTEMAARIKCGATTAFEDARGNSLIIPLN